MVYYKIGMMIPYLIDMPSASMVTAWSGDGKYIASGNFDNTVTVLKYGSPQFLG